MYLALVAGGHASGKRTVTSNLVDKLAAEASSVCDLHIKALNLRNYQRANHKPDIDYDGLLAEIDEFERGEGYKAMFIFGNYALLNEELCSRAQLKIFLDTDADVRLSQWILRDSINGKRTPLADVLEEYLDHCRPEFECFIEPTKQKADVLLPQGSDPLNIELISTGVLEEILTHDQHATATSSIRSRNMTSMINLRAEAANDVESQYYSTA